MKFPIFKVILPLALLSLFTAQAWSDTVHAENLVQLVIKNDSTPSSVSIGLNDAVAIVQPEDITFIQGVEITIKIPRNAITEKSKLSWNLYECTFIEENNAFVLSGEKTSSGYFGNLLSLTFKIPFVSNHTIKKDPYSILINTIPDIKKKQLYLCLSSESEINAEDIQVEVFGKPIYSNKGMLKLNVYTPEKKLLTDNFTVFIDGKAFDTSVNLMIPVGEHNLSIQSDLYRFENRNFTIERAKKTVLNINLIDIAPMVRVSAPSNTIIFLDGVEIPTTSEYFVITEGQHVFKLVTGDYEIVRTLVAQNGRNYTLSLNLEVNISEDN